MRISLVAVALLAACTYPKYVARKIVDCTIPTTYTANLLCQTHNGNITVAGESNTTQVEVHAELSVRGYTQEEADANLLLLEVGREQQDGTLHLFVKYPWEELSNRSPSGTFTLKVPQDLGLALESHNGDLSVRGARGNVRLDTHNGSIDATVESAELATSTHNGNIRLALAGSGPHSSKVTSHNGSVRVRMPEGAGAMLDASTHNGRVAWAGQVVDATYERGKLRGRIGDGKGSLRVSTHNGDIRIE